MPFQLKVPGCIEEKFSVLPNLCFQKRDFHPLNLHKHVPFLNTEKQFSCTRNFFYSWAWELFFLYLEKAPPEKALKPHNILKFRGI